MNINIEILQLLIINSCMVSFSYHDNIITDLLEKKKIELDPSLFSECGDMKRKLEVCHLTYAYQNYTLFLEDKTDIYYLYKKGTQCTTDFFSDNIRPSNFEASKTFLESFLLDREIEELSDQAICFISPFLAIIQPNDFKKTVLDILNEYIKEEKKSTAPLKFYIDKLSKVDNSDFEELSRTNKIVFSTSLKRKTDIFFIIKLFHLLYDGRLYLLSNFEYFQPYLLRNKAQFDKDNLDKDTLLAKLNNIILDDYIIESEVLPEPNDSIKTRSTKKQKVFTLKDIKKLIK